MTDWVDAIDASALTDCEHVLLEVDGYEVALFNVGGEFYAIENQCSHAAVALAEGAVEGDQIVCPLHGARFCLKTGVAKCPPAYEPIQVFPVRIAAGKVQVGDLW